MPLSPSKEQKVDHGITIMPFPQCKTEEDTIHDSTVPAWALSPDRVKQESFVKNANLPSEFGRVEQEVSGKNNDLPS